ncbi:MAG: hypothetical protein GF355_01070 [Candidatus Eisenbacteria bacterium]|nr:hypothetical protein [Candidatus Eisenbacteria bacterium]
MSKFDTFIEDLRGEIKILAREAGKEMAGAALKDSRTFIRKAKKDLERWTRLLAKGDLTADEFEFLVEAKRDLAVMEALKQEGLSRIRVERFRRRLIDLVVSTAFRVFL